MVNHMVLDDTVEDVAADEAKIAVNGRKRALFIRPYILFVARSLGMSMMQECYGDWNKLANFP